MKNHGLTLEDADRLIDRIVEFPGVPAAFERVRPITDFRKDDAEARVLFVCRRIRSSDSTSNAEEVDLRRGQQGRADGLYVLKYAVIDSSGDYRAPSVLAGGLTTPVPGPSEHTAAEVEALQVFADAHSPSLPHLVAWKKAVQGADGPMPGGYMVFVVMTLLPGSDLMALKFWSMPDAQREEIRAAFLVAIKRVWTLGFQPYDRALRNILWEAETKTLSLVDFEHWHPMDGDKIINMTEREELEKWGLVHSPAAKTHWEAFFRMEGLTRKGG